MRHTPLQLFYHISLIGLRGLTFATLLWYGMPATWGILTGTLERGAWHAAVAAHLGRFSPARVAGLLLLNGVSYFTYNQVSFIVLSKTTVVTHAVGNGFRRVVTIICSVLYFRNVVTTTNVAGILLAVFGVCSYSYAKTLEKPQAKAAPLPR